MSAFFTLIETELFLRPAAERCGLAVEEYVEASALVMASRLKVAPVLSSGSAASADDARVALAELAEYRRRRDSGGRAHG